MLIAGLAVLVVAILIGSLIAIQTPGYPDTAPYDRAQLLSMVRQLNDDPENRVWEGSRGSRADQSSLFAAVTPEGCGTIRAFGNSSFTAAEYSVSEDYDIRSSASGFGWLNARLFTSPEKALEYVAAVEEAVGRCPEFQSPEEEYQLNWASASWPSGAAGADYAFRYKAQERDSWSHYVLVVRENALFVVELGDSASPAQAGQFYRAVQELEIDERS